MHPEVTGARGCSQATAPAAAYLPQGWPRSEVCPAFWAAQAGPRPRSLEPGPAARPTPHAPRPTGCCPARPAAGGGGLMRPRWPPAKRDSGPVFVAAMLCPASRPAEWRSCAGASRPLRCRASAVSAESRTRLTDAFQAALRRNQCVVAGAASDTPLTARRPALIPFICAGDPDLATTARALRALDEVGAASDARALRGTLVAAC